MEVEVGDDEDLDQTNELAPGMPDIQQQAAGSNTGFVTLEAIGDLMEQKLTPITNALTALLSDFSAFKESVRKELKEVGCKLQTFETEAAKTASRVQQLEDNLAKLKLGDFMTPKVYNERENTVVLGSIPDANCLDQAKSWIQKLCTDSGLPQPIDIYSKGEYKSIVFAKCTSPSHRDLLISRVTNMPATSLSRPWAKVDRPIDVRTAQSTLFGFKRMLIS